jgi:predicted TIM-barrel fold metal-dependent hydrolase
MPIIDADAHVIETEHTWDFMDGSDSQFRPILVSSQDRRKQFWLIDGRPIPVGPVAQDLPAGSSELRQIESRLRHMDQLGIDVQVLYPTVFITPVTTRPEVELALCRSYNRWLSELCAKAENRLRWIAVIPILNMDYALAETKFAVENRACGLFMRGLVEDKLLSDPYFYPLYDLASNRGIAICVHASTGDFEWVNNFQRESGFSLFKLPVLIAFHTLVYKGIPQLFPNLRFGFIEVKAQWVPYLIHELARRFQARGKTIASDIMRDNRLYVACQTDDDLPYILKYSGENNIVIGTDYGHNDTSSEIEALKRIRREGEVSSEVIDKILFDNPKALYNL